MNAVMLSLHHYKVAVVKLIQKRNMCPTHYKRPSSHQEMIFYTHTSPQKCILYTLSTHSALIAARAATSPTRFSREAGIYNVPLMDSQQGLVSLQLFLPTNHPSSPGDCQLSGTSKAYCFLKDIVLS